jgi:hypothetical protein
MFNTYIIIKIHISTVNCVPRDAPGVITLEFIRLTVAELTIPAVEFTTVVITIVGETTFAVATVEISIGGVTNGGINELCVVDKVEVCVILVDKTLFAEDVVGIGTGV